MAATPTPLSFAVSTHWNAWRHTDGRALAEEILSAGADRLELGYDLRLDLVPGLQSMIDEQAITIDSVHHICPVPVGVPRGHPELWTPASPDRDERRQACEYLVKTAEFAASVKAKVVVAHAGNIKMKRLSRECFRMLEENRQFTPRYEKLKLKLLTSRDKKARKQIEFLHESLDYVLPHYQRLGIHLGLEILPTWEAVPTEVEFEDLFRRYPDTPLRYWHDIGHSQIRENLGFINSQKWLEKLRPHLAGMHIHDVRYPAQDHVTPGRGSVHFERFQSAAVSDIVRVLELAQKAAPEDVTASIAHLRQCWQAEEPREETSEQAMGEA